MQAMTHTSLTPEPPCPRRSLAELALWLTEAEAEALLTLCAMAHGNGDPVEHRVFEKLGACLRAYHAGRPTPAPASS